MTIEPSNGLIERYERARQEGGACYFDADEFEEIAFQYELQSQVEQSLQTIEDGLQLHPSNISLKIKQAKYLLLNDRIIECQEIINDISEDTPDLTLIKAEMALIQDNVPQAEKLLLTLMRSEQIDNQAAFCASDLLLEYEYPYHAANVLVMAIERWPKSIDIKRELAFIYEDIQEFDQAINLYNQLLDQDPYNSMDWFNLAKVYALDKQYELAIDACEYALIEKPDDSQVLLFKGCCLFDLGQHQKVIDFIASCQEIIQEKNLLHELLAECFSKIGDPTSAISQLEQALKISGPNTHLYYQIALSLDEQGNTLLAIETLQKAIALTPDDLDSMILLAELYMEQPRGYSQSKELLEKVLKIEPQNTQALVLMADLYSSEEEPIMALKLYQEALQLNKEDYRLLIKLILITSYQGQHSLLEEYLQLFDSLVKDMEIKELPSDWDRDEFLAAKDVIDQLRDLLKE